MPKTTQSSPKASYIRDMTIQFTLFRANVFIRGEKLSTLLPQQ